jgi:hypothetical protein
MWGEAGCRWTLSVPERRRYYRLWRQRLFVERVRALLRDS